MDSNYNCGHRITCMCASGKYEDSEGGGGEEVVMIWENLYSQISVFKKVSYTLILIFNIWNNHKQNQFIVFFSHGKLTGMDNT